MERLTIRRDGKVLLRNHPTIRQILDKIAEYEDLEESLENIYGDCPNLLKAVVETLKTHSTMDEKPMKSRLLTDEDVDRWLEYKKRLKE